MSGQHILQTVTTALPFLLFAVVGIIVILRRQTTNWGSLAAPGTAPDHALVVPIRGLYLRRAGILGGTSHNSIDPNFAIAPDAIHYRVFRDGRLPFAGIDHVDVRLWLGRPHVLFVNAGNPRLLSVAVGDQPTAKRVLDALPSAVPLTPEAATIRDGVPAAGTSGLQRYGGRYF